MDASNLRGAVIGAGYFSRFHIDAWSRIPEVTISAIADLERAKAQAHMDTHAIDRFYADYRALIDTEKPDFVDIITPPATHHEIAAYAAARGCACDLPKAVGADLCGEQGIGPMRCWRMTFALWRMRIGVGSLGIARSGA